MSRETQSSSKEELLEELESIFIRLAKTYDTDLNPRNAVVEDFEGAIEEILEDQNFTYDMLDKEFSAELGLQENFVYEKDGILTLNSNENVRLERIEGENRYKMTSTLANLAAGYRDFNLYGLLNRVSVRARIEVSAGSTEETVEFLPASQPVAVELPSKTAPALEAFKKVLLMAGDIKDFKRQFKRQFDALNDEELREFFAHKGEKNRNPLHRAAMSNNADLCQLFLSKVTETERNAADVDGNPPLYMLAYDYEGVSEDFARTYTLLKKNGNDEIENNDGQTLADLFREYGDFEYEKIILLVEGEQHIINDVFAYLETGSNTENSASTCSLEDLNQESSDEGIIFADLSSCIKGITSANVQHKEAELTRLLGVGVNDIGAECDFAELAQRSFEVNGAMHLNIVQVAAEFGMFKLLGSLLREPDLSDLVQTKTRDNSTVLHLLLQSEAADKRNPDFLSVVSNLVARDNDPNVKNDKGITPMHQAREFSGFWTNLFGNNPVVKELQSPKAPDLLVKTAIRERAENSELEWTGTDTFKSKAVKNRGSIQLDQDRAAKELSGGSWNLY
jgi:ankyrin repeat protein